MIKKFYFTFFAILCALVPATVWAQSFQQNFTVENGRLVANPGNNAQGNSGSAPHISEELSLMMQAPKYVVARDFKTAESIYSKVLSLNGGNIEAYLQRAFVRREMNDRAGVISDAQSVVTLSNGLLQNDPRNATLFYERGQGFRLLQQFDQARIDIQGAIQLSGNSTWDTDLKAIDLEQKMSQ